MELNNKVAVITGGGSGIGKALAARFMAEGARQVVVVDINADNAAAVARELGCVAMTADVSVEADIARLIADTESKIGPIDLFCSNAGVGLGESLASPNAEWQLSWDVNVMPHVYAARHLVPRMVERGGGYLLNTASAAGLLSQIGGAAYAVSKHAAVGFAEWLAIHHAHEGIKVSLLCPQAVRTPMTAGDNEGVAAASVDGMMEPEDLADIVIAGLRNECFLILTHEEVLEYMRRKTSDYDRWIGGMNRLMKKLSGVG
ncbi:MAG: SDR family oxidoreductase [Gammaproteobacteria bacterium]|nr:SDR family oxidoreductase [Gammaproteobacteria bacterium]